MGSEGSVDRLRGLLHPCQRNLGPGAALCLPLLLGGERGEAVLELGKTLRGPLRVVLGEVAGLVPDL